MWSKTDGEMHQSKNGKAKKRPVRRSEVNWLIQREGNEYVAIEPGRRYETPFDSFDEALEYAAAKIKEG